MSKSIDRASASAWLMLALLVLFYIFSFLDRTVISMIIDPIRADLKIDDVQISLLVGLAFAVAYAIGGLPMGWLVDNVERRWVLYGAVTFWGMAEALCGFSTSFAQLFGARMLVGLGEGGLSPAAHSLISDAFPKRRLATALSIYSMGAVIGAGLSLVLGGLVVEQLSTYPIVDVPLIGTMKSWQFIFFVTGVPGIALAFLIFLVPEPRRKGTGAGGGAPASTWRGMALFLRQRWRLWLTITLVFGGINIINGGLIYWQPAYFSRYFHWSPAQYGLALGLISAFAGAGGMLFSGAVIDRLFARGMKDAHLRYYWWAIILSTPFVLIAMLSTNAWVYIGLIWIAKFALVNFLGFASALVQITTPNQLRGRMAAVFTTVIAGLLGSVFGPMIPALICKHILHDEVQLGQAMAITVMIFVPIALAGIRFGLKPLREAVEEAEGWSAQPSLAEGRAAV